MASLFLLGACTPPPPPGDTGEPSGDHAVAPAPTVAAAVVEGSDPRPSEAVDAAVRIRVEGGPVVIGDAADPLASPTIAFEVGTFALDRDEVSVARFAEFVAATGHRTVAEELGRASVFVATERAWRPVEGATWLHPDANSARRAYNNHPVTQVALADAAAFCAWSGGRLPTEFEWEFAARNAGRTAPSRYPWGEELMVDGRFRANVWQGWFPNRNTMEDGYFGTAPLQSFDPTPLGFTNLVGNVSEWTATPFAPFAVAVLGNFSNDADRTVRGGSYLCDPSASHGCGVATREAMAVESAMSNLGFRCAYEAGVSEGSAR